MNKFDELQVQLENIIASINKQINFKETELKNTRQRVNDESKEIYNLHIKEKAFKDEKNELSKIAGKNILLAVLQQQIREFKEGIEKEVKYSKLLRGLVISLACLAFAIFAITLLSANPVIILGTLSIYWLITSIPRIRKISKLKNGKSFDDIDREIEENEEVIQVKQRRVELSTEDAIRLEKEISALKKEKTYYEEALRSVLATKEQIISQRVSSILNREFDEQKFSDIIRRIRLKKEGEENNGEII